MRFLKNIEEFETQDIDLQDEIKSQQIPTARIATLDYPLERNLNRKDQCLVSPSEEERDYVEFNIGSQLNPKIIKIGKDTSDEERRNIENLIREYRDVFAWSYDDLKAYKEDIIQHTIPLKEDAKPYRQKLRNINPTLAPLIKKE